MISRTRLGGKGVRGYAEGRMWSSEVFNSRQIVRFGVRARLGFPSRTLAHIHRATRLRTSLRQWLWARGRRVGLHVQSHALPARAGPNQVSHILLCPWQLQAVHVAQDLGIDCIQLFLQYFSDLLAL